jgi:hypothetical protein
MKLEHHHCRPRSGSCRQGDREDFAGGNVPRIVGLREFGQRKPAIGQGDGRLGPGTAQGRAAAEKESQIVSGFDVRMDRVSRTQQCPETHQRREPADRGREVCKLYLAMHGLRRARTSASTSQWNMNRRRKCSTREADESGAAMAERNACE